MKPTFRKQLERTLLLTERPAFVLFSISVNLTAMVLLLATVEASWVYWICTVGALLIALDVRYLLRILRSRR